jgi:hypothetical protein
MANTKINFCYKNKNNWYCFWKAFCFLFGFPTFFLERKKPFLNSVDTYLPCQCEFEMLDYLTLLNNKSLNKFSRRGILAPFRRQLQTDPETSETDIRGQILLRPRRQLGHRLLL